MIQVVMILIAWQKQNIVELARQNQDNFRKLTSIKLLVTELISEDIGKKCFVCEHSVSVK